MAQLQNMANASSRVRVLKQVILFFVIPQTKLQFHEPSTNSEATKNRYSIDLLGQIVMVSAIRGIEICHRERFTHHTFKSQNGHFSKHPNVSALAFVCLFSMNERSRKKHHRNDNITYTSGFKHSKNLFCYYLRMMIRLTAFHFFPFSHSCSPERSVLFSI